MKNIIVMFLSAFLVGTVSLLFVAKKANNSLDKDLKIARSSADSLSKVAGLLDQNVKKFRDESDSLAAKNKALEKSITQTNSKLAATERVIWKNKNASTEVNKKYDDLRKSHGEMIKQLTALKSANEQLGQENKTLLSKATSLSDANIELTSQLAVAKIAAKDNILIETKTKGGKLNLKGRRVRKIVLSLNLRSEMKNPTFRVFDPNGIVLPEEYGLFDLKKINETSINAPSVNSPKIELTYLPSKKIGPGLYRIEMLDENKHVGNLLVRFR